MSIFIYITFFPIMGLHLVVLIKLKTGTLKQS